MVESKAFVPGYKHDIFVSYAEVDDQPMRGAKEGWVTVLIKDLRVYLNQRIGSPDAYSLWSFHQLRGHVPKTEEIANILQETALFIVILSPGYRNSSRCQSEKEAFLRSIKDKKRRDSRIFVIEQDMLKPEEIPDEFVNLQRYKFWIIDREGKPPLVLGRPETREREEKYCERLSDLSYDLKEELLTLKADFEKEQKTIFEKPILEGEQITEKTFPGNFLQSTSKTVFLAEVIDNSLEDFRNRIKNSLQQKNIRVLPEKYYSRTPEEFKKSMLEDLQRSDLFVQLLSDKSEKTCPDLPQGYSLFQYEIVCETEVPILQWCSLESYPILGQNSVLQDILQEGHVVAMQEEALKTEILQRLSLAKTPPKLPEKLNDFLKWVFVNAHSEDESLENEICKKLSSETFKLGYLQRIREKNPTKSREHFEKSVLVCNALIVVYGKIPVNWVRDQILEIVKIASQRPKEDPLTLFSVYDGPPPEKPPLPIHFPKLQIIPCRNCLDEQKLGKFLEPLLRGEQ